MCSAILYRSGLHTPNATSGVASYLDLRNVATL